MQYEINESTNKGLLEGNGSDRFNTSVDVEEILCVLTEDEQLHLQKQFGKAQKLSAQPEVAFSVCVPMQQLHALQVSAFS